MRIRIKRKKVFVVKYGGSIVKNKSARDTFLSNIKELKMSGANIVIVHGGGSNISDILMKMDIEIKFINGLRLTDKKTMEVVEMVLSGQVNKELTSALCNIGVNAVGLSGRDGNLIRATKKYVYQMGHKIDIGYVGDVVAVNIGLLEDLLQRGYIPVISPIGCDKEGNAYNINADYVAASISTALKCDKLILMSDVDGLYKNLDDPASLISEITVPTIRKYITKGVIRDGMIPKMECCIKAIEGGTKAVHLVDGRKKNSLLLNVLLEQRMGTIIKDLW